MSLETSELVWKSKKGRRTKIKDMNTSHLVNAIKLIERGEHDTIDKDHEKYHALKAELTWRGKSKRQEKIIVNGIDQDACASTGLMGKKAKFDEPEKAS